MRKELEVSRTMSREEAAEYFIEVGRRLRDEGVVEVCGEEVAVPDRVELEVEYEREPGEAEFELEIEWRTGGRERSAGETGVEGGADPGSRPEFDDVKEEMRALMKEMHRAAAGNELPDRSTLSRFLEFNAAFERMASDEPYAHRMAEYSALVENMEAEYESGDLDRFHGLLEEVSIREETCHAEFR